MRLGLALLTAATTLWAGGAQAEFTADRVRMGVLNDMSGLYADIAGQRAVLAARMAVEDFGGQEKAPAESRYSWDCYKLRATIPAGRAFRPLAEGGCPLVKG
jgi:branched-chain amino acid transport system substrate-binding protein